MKRNLLGCLFLGALSGAPGCFLHHAKQGVVRPHATDRVVLPYDGFGPQAMAFELIGYSWNQWKNEGHPGPDDVPVQVVVYRGVGIEQIREAYPVIRGRTDYRYVEYDDALLYLETHLRDLALAAKEEPDGEETWTPLSARLAKTREQIRDVLGER